MFLGIEIGGTKLQLGVGPGDGAPPRALERFDVQPEQGALGILRRIESAATTLINRHQVSAIGIGFGGPVDTAAGHVLKSHQIEGWDNFALADWCRQRLGLPAQLQNDCDLAALAEARFGAGRHHKVVFYVTVGTGIGGGLVIEGRIYRGHGPAPPRSGICAPVCTRTSPSKRSNRSPAAGALPPRRRSDLPNPTRISFCRSPAAAVRTIRNKCGNV